MCAIFGPGTDLATLTLDVIHPGDDVRAWTDNTDSNPFVYSAVLVGNVDESR